MNISLADYYKRIGLSLCAPVSPDLAGLTAIHRAQAFAIPYEGLDIQFGNPLDLDRHRIFDKLVRQRRGGWCYETNGLLGWALTRAGFQVMRCTAGVHRRDKGDAALGNHLTLVVTLPQGRFLADLGLGDGIRAPLPLTEGTHRDGALTFRLERLPDGCWRFHNHADGTPETFDFRDIPADEALFQQQNHTLQTDPQSHFILNAECVRMHPDHSVTLLGRILRRSGPAGRQKTRLDTPDQLQAVLASESGLTNLPVSRIWPQIIARHRHLFGE